MQSTYSVHSSGGGGGGGVVSNHILGGKNFSGSGLTPGSRSSRVVSETQIVA